jgi:hypothetical protein
VNRKAKNNPNYIIYVGCLVLNRSPGFSPRIKFTESFLTHEYLSAFAHDDDDCSYNMYE